MAQIFTASNIRKPTLTPDFDPVGAPSNVPGSGDSILTALDPASIAALHAASVPATGVITITNAGSGGSTITATIRGKAIAVTNGGADTATTLATALALAINIDPVVGLFVRATSLAGVVTVEAIYRGQIPNAFSFSVAAAGGTAAASVTTAWGNGAGELITPLENFTIQVGKSTLACRANKPFRGSPAIRTAISGASSGYLVS